MRNTNALLGAHEHENAMSLYQCLTLRIYTLR
jgi:hypothetical protein